MTIFLWFCLTLWSFFSLAYVQTMKRQLVLYGANLIRQIIGIIIT